MRDSFNKKGVSEATGMRVIAYYLEGEEIYVHEDQVRSVTDDPEKEIFGERESLQ